MHVLVIITSMTSPPSPAPPHSLCSCHIPLPRMCCCCLRALALATLLPGNLFLYTPACLSVYLYGNVTFLVRFLLTTLFKLQILLPWLPTLWILLTFLYFFHSSCHQNPGYSLMYLLNIFRLFSITRTEAPQQQTFSSDLFTDVSLVPRTVPGEA